METVNSLEWHNEKRKISDLKFFEGNPRKMSKEQADQLISSLKKFNIVEIPAINTDNTILAGNMRIQALITLKRQDEEIDVRVPNRVLNENEAREYLIRSNKNTGEWDWDILANTFEIDSLVNWGFLKEELGIGENFESVMIDEQGKLDEKKKVKCPNCGEEFESK